MRIPCPFCGVRDLTEFAYGGDAGARLPPLEAPEAVWREAVYLRDNPCGRQWETWQHRAGCGTWLLIERDTLTHEILNVRLAHPDWAAALETEACG